MKVSYYDMFDLLAEEAGQLLSQYEDQDISLEDFTADRTIRAVKSQIKERLQQQLIITHQFLRYSVGDQQSLMILTGRM